MLTEERIGGGVAGEDAVAKMAVAAVVGEEPGGAASRLMDRQIGGGLKLPVVLGAP